MGSTTEEEDWELEFIEKEILGKDTFCGRSKRIHNERELARQAVNKAINRALEKIEQKLGNSHEVFIDLQTNVKLGHRCRYSGDLNWQLISN